MIDEIIKIRINLDEEDPLYFFFNELKKKTALKANTEVIRYAIKKAYDYEILNEQQEDYIQNDKK